MVAEPTSSGKSNFRRKRRWVKARRYAVATLAAILLVYNVWSSIRLTNAEPDDAKVYTQIAKNVVDRDVYSTDSTAPFQPTIIRLPGYPLTIAGMYSLFGEGNDQAVRVLQGILHFLSAIIAGVLAFIWGARKRRRRRVAAIAAFMLAAVCPFTLIYTGVLLTEVATMFLMAAMTLSASLAIRSGGKKSLILWALTGLIAGLAAEFRPEAGLFAAGVGLTLVIASFSVSTFKKGILDSLVNGAIFTLVFVLVLMPWTIRNYRVFGLFQPIAPANAEMPDEFVPHGYLLWLRTWLTDIRQVDTMEWSLEKQRIDIRSIPDSAFANDDERARVTALIDNYNNSDPDHPMKTDARPGDSKSDDDSSDDSDDSENPDSDDSADSEPPDESHEELDLKITPDVDAAFAQIARERIQRDPATFYFVLPAERMANMWFDTHSEYYSFAGELFPLKDLDAETYQSLWLPLFVAIVWIYSVLAVAGMLLLLFSGSPRSRLFVVMLLLIALPRAVFISRLEDPEPRYFVEYFIFASVLAGIALSRISITFGKGRFLISLLYGREHNS
jgi:hypothetical protein